MHFKLVAVSVCFASIMACGKGPKHGGDSSPAPKDETQVFGLVGLAGTTYKSDCQIVQDKNRSEVEVVNFGENTFEKIWMNFDGPDCNEGKKRTTYSYSVVNVEKELSPDIGGWDTYVYAYDSVTAMTHTVIITKTFNKENGYGYDDWAVNEPKDISGRKYGEKSEVKAAKGEIRKSTLKIEGSTLSLARYKDGKAQVEDPFVYQKQ